VPQQSQKELWDEHGTLTLRAPLLRPRSAADSLIRSTVDISHLRQPGNPPARSFSFSTSVRSDVILGVGTVRWGGHPSVFSSMSPGVVHCPDDSVSVPPLSGRGNYLSQQSPTWYHSASSSPSARCPSSGFDGVNEEANVRADATVVDGHADVRASAVKTEANDDGANVSNLDDILNDILGASSRVATPLDLDLAFCAVDVTDRLSCTSLLSALSPLLLPIASPLSFCCYWGAHLRSRSFH